MIIKQAIIELHRALSPVSSSARLDAELLVGLCCEKTRTELHTYPETILTVQEQNTLKNLLQRRLAGEPMAYILGHQEFWSMQLKVSPDVLIPRPETECLVSWILENFPENKADFHVADLGTGSGAIALALAKERSNWEITATDQSEAALAIAKHNAKNQRLEQIKFFQGNWCSALPGKKYDIIISNPPYIAQKDPHLKDLQYEPVTALVSGCEGLDAIRQIIQEAKYYLAAGYLILEHGYQQADHVQALLKQANYREIQSHYDLENQLRFTSAKY